MMKKFKSPAGTRIIKVLTVIVIFWILPRSLNAAEPLRFQHLGNRNGLSDGRVDVILQDHSGFLWIGTQDGLNRYDGYAFKVFHHSIGDSAGLSSNWIRALYEDGRGFIWIGTEGGGLNRFDPETEQFRSWKYNPEDSLSLSDNFVRSVTRLDEKRLLIATRDGLSIFEENSEIFRTWKTRNADGSLAEFRDNVTTLARDRQGRLWIGTSDHVYIWTPGQETLQFLRADESPFRVTCITEDGNGRMWVGSRYHGVAVFDRDLTLYARYHHDTVRESSLSNDEIKDIYQDENGSIWLATMHGGLNRFDTETGEFSVYRHNSQDASTLSNNSVRCIYQDRTGILWLGLDGSGIDYTDASLKPFSGYSNQPGNSLDLSSNTILAMLARQNGELWLGTEGGGIDVLKDFTGPCRHFRAGEGLPSNQITAFHEAADTIWIGTKDGLAAYIGSTQRFYSYRNAATPTIANNFINCIAGFPGGRLVLGTNNGLQIFNPLNRTFTKWNPDSSAVLDNENVVSLYSDPSGEFLYAAYLRSGVLKIDLKTDHTYQYRSDAPEPYRITSNFVQYIMKDTRNRIWIATRNGLNRLDTTGVIQQYSRESALPGNVITGILEDHEGSFWISTSNGLARYREDRNLIVSYDAEDGLLGNQFWPRSCTSFADTLLCFGGNNGLTVFSPKNVETRRPRSQPSVVITAMFVNDREIPVSEFRGTDQKHPLILNSGQNQVAFEYSVLDFRRPDKNQFASRLVGFNNDWVYSGNRHYLNYTNLYPGKYRFIVRGADRDGRWNNVVNGIYFHIQAPLWRRWYAFVFYFIITVSLIWSVNVYVLGLIRTRHDLKFERMEKERAEELNRMKLQYFTDIAHEFKTPLTLIQAPLEDIYSQLSESPVIGRKIRIMTRNVNYLVRLVRQLMEFRKAESGKAGLSLQKQNITALTADLFQLFADRAVKLNAHYDLKCIEQPVTGLIDQDKYEEIFINLLDNAFKYSGNSPVIRVELDKILRNGQSCISLSVFDNGPGFTAEQQEHVFERFFSDQRPARPGGASTGIGLSLTKRLVELHRGEITLLSSPETGSGFTVILPIDEESYDAENIRTGKGNGHIQPLHRPWLLADETEYEEPGDQLPRAGAGERLLIVEDNPDLRTFLSDNLSEGYDVITAAHGRAGLDKTFMVKPDLIISDVMMPEMDGLDLCARLKADLRSSHIPVILLTARSAVEQRIAGMETGADDYIDKPFSLQFLRARIANLLKNRDLLKERYRREFILEPGGSDVPASQDEELLGRIRQAVIENMSDPSLDVSALAVKCGLSRTALFDKLKALTGFSPNEFIRRIRLEKARRLLADTELNISEIAYSLGFNYPKYFSSSFQKDMGLSPSEFRKNEKGKS